METVTLLGDLEVSEARRCGVDDQGERRVLESAGWEPEDRDGETIWRNPEDGNWYEQRRAIELVEGGEDVGSVD